jgi:hypothetical protein
MDGGMRKESLQEPVQAQVRPRLLVNLALFQTRSRRGG